MSRFHPIKESRRSTQAEKRVLRNVQEYLTRYGDQGGSTGETLPPGDASGQVLGWDGEKWTAVTVEGTVATAYYEPLTNGDIASPELLFANGDCIMVQVV